MVLGMKVPNGGSFKDLEKLFPIFMGYISALFIWVFIRTTPIIY
jgi:hypothetical protein